MDILEVIISSGIISTLVVLSMQTFLTERIKASIKIELDKKYEIWNIKREACLEALKIADSTLSNMTWSNISKEENNKIRKQESDTIKARECYSKLATTCESPEVLKQFKKL